MVVHDSVVQQVKIQTVHDIKTIIHLQPVSALARLFRCLHATPQPTNLLPAYQENLAKSIWGWFDGFFGVVEGWVIRGDGADSQRWEWGADKGDIRDYCLFAQVQNSSPLSMRNDLRFFLNMVVSTTSLTSLGSKFHNFGPVCEKARHPYLLWNLVTCRFMVLEESPYWIICMISSGAFPRRQLCTIRRIL